jgi:hypothetical protein
MCVMMITVLMCVITVLMCVMMITVLMCVITVLMWGIHGSGVGVGGADVGHARC